MSSDARLANPGIHFPPPFVYAGGIVAGWLLHRAWPLPIFGHPTPVRTVLALLGFLGWLACFLPAIGAFRRAHTTLIPNRPAEALVTTGIYARTRNPMYVSLVLLYLGVTFLVNSWWTAIVLPVVVLVIDRWVIGREETYLTGAFPEQYPAYCARVRRWL
jgi:protein-S-isoprenylcysteine O-methyltransferase Ste14